MKRKTTRTRRASRTDPRASSARQRLRLIDACISALHLYGPSGTTVQKVVALAGMSPGIVRFYFASKDAMLVAALQFLAAEFEQRVLEPVLALREQPVQALARLVELYLDADLASPRKVSVWYSFWGEASSRQEYFDICGQKDARFAELVRELVGRLIVQADLPHLDPDGVALGLIGSLEILWQDFAFQSESQIDRPGAHRRILAYLRSVFPQQFPASLEAPAASHDPVAGWHIVAHECALGAPGRYVCATLPIGAVLVLRDEAGHLRAFRNRCPRGPHRLLGEDSHGALPARLHCPIHGTAYDWLGRSASDPALPTLEVAAVGGLIVVAEAGVARCQWPVLLPPALEPAGQWAFDLPVGVELLAAHWLKYELPTSARGRLEGWLRDLQRSSGAQGSTVWSAALTRAPGAASASARAYSALLPRGSRRWQRWLLPPGQLVELREDGASILQAVAARGGTRVRWLEYRTAEGERRVRALGYLARRLRRAWLAQDREYLATTSAAAGR